MTTATAPKPRRLTEKQVKAVLGEYDLASRVHALMLEHGAQKVPEWRDAPTEAWSRRWILETSAGPLSVHPYDDSIMCRFDDAAAGARLFGATYPSGKWNFHAFVKHCHGPTSREEMHEALDRMLRDFTERMKWALPGETR